MPPEDPRSSGAASWCRLACVRRRSFISADEPPSIVVDVVGATTLLNRVVAYVDQLGPR